MNQSSFSRGEDFPMPGFEDITYVVEDSAAILTINRPERYN